MSYRSPPTFVPGASSFSPRRRVGANDVGANDVGANDVGANDVGTNGVGTNGVGVNGLGITGTAHSPVATGSNNVRSPVRAVPRNGILPSIVISTRGFVLPTPETLNRGYAQPSRNPTERHLEPGPIFLDEMDPRNKNNFISRYIHIVRFPSMTEFVQHPMKLVENIIKKYTAFASAVPLDISGNIRLRFDSIADACTGQQILINEGFRVQFISQKEHARAKFQDLSSLNDFEGQILLIVYTNRTLNGHEVFHLQEVVRQIMATRFKSSQHIPGVREMIPIGTIAHDRFVFRIEFDSVNAATRVVKCINTHYIRGHTGAYEWWTGGAREYDNPPYSSLSTPDRDEHGRLMGFEHQPMPSAKPTEKEFKHHHDFKNRVHRDRVLNGGDIRTTIMLRNIPNKLDHMGLKNILDKHCFGMYDFLYLRIDFDSGCNVGYAFVNFVYLDGLYDMMVGMEGLPWEGFNSQKCAEVSYATIQGKDALVTRFRNSSVMEELPYCRPRLICSWDEARRRGDHCAVGCDLPFPGPNNKIKLDRSVQCARQQGLFPPHGGIFGGSVNIDNRLRPGLLDNGNPRDQSFQMPGDQTQYAQMMRHSYRNPPLHPLSDPEMIQLDRQGRLIAQQGRSVAHFHPMIGHHGQIVEQQGAIAQQGPSIDHPSPMVGHHDQIVDQQGPSIRHLPPMVGRHGQIVDQQGSSIGHLPLMVGHHGQIVGQQGQIVGHHGQIVGQQGAIEQQGAIGQQGPSVGHYPHWVGQHEQTVPVWRRRPVPVAMQYPQPAAVDVGQQYTPVSGQHRASFSGQQHNPHGFATRGTMSQPTTPSRHGALGSDTGSDESTPRPPPVYRGRQRTRD